MKPSASKSGMRLSSILRWGITLFAIGLLVYLLSSQGWGEIMAAVRQISWRLFLFALTFTVLSRLAVAGRWYVLLRSASLPITPWQGLRITFAGLFASNFLPTTIGGDVVRLGGALRLKFDQTVCLASLVVDRLVGMAGMAMALPFMLPVLSKGFSLVSTGSAGMRINPGMADQACHCGKMTGLINQFSFFFSGIPLLAQIESPKIPWIQQFRDWVRRSVIRFTGAFRLWARQPLALLWALGFSWGHMLCWFTSIWVLLNSMGETLPLWLIAGLWSITYFVTLLPISINGIGVQELTMVFMFTHFGGVSQTAGLTLVLCIRVLQMLASLPGAWFLPGMVMGDR